ncbi:coatomer protein complex, subunit zeta 1-like protein [Fimicolochytrium jonesii]|uniref:coatomer protein complex, subunit zeta 1-like protein n=1 Tax=Fimicolochytrium jonesii TaxID=1396493 RepID=UPI0022FDE824|nr:coatomer protein complex, subunit zeta 1-like protein [Fimicolochytrium jonesii]KAI8816435.1 coatomer protein complex, subunit zeta 1-like protein [Fimicolochytrium jonesii]
MVARPHLTTLYTTKAVIILDSEGKRILAKYYQAEYPTLKEQRVFEKSLFDKTKKTNSEIILFDNQIVVYKNSIDLLIYVLGSAEENELILSHLLNSFYETLSILLKGLVEKRTILENYDLVALALDETVDGGIILESEPSITASRVTKKNETEAEPSLSQMFQKAQEQVARSLLH